MSQKIVQYLNEAHATEVGLVRVLQEQTAMTPPGSYRDAVERHLKETQDHARRVEQRLKDLGDSSNPIQVTIGVAESVLGQVLALSKTPLDILRGHGGDEKVLKNAKDACATEALEIATYIALEELAEQFGDAVTAELARDIRADEERMLATIQNELPGLTAAVARREGRAVADTAEPWPGYDKQATDEIIAKVARFDEDVRARVARYERDHKRRQTVIEAATREPAAA
jgi:ferritin-like metal-binding protein YciE